MYHSPQQPSGYTCYNRSIADYDTRIIIRILLVSVFGCYMNATYSV